MHHSQFLRLLIGQRGSRVWVLSHAGLVLPCATVVFLPFNVDKGINFTACLVDLTCAFAIVDHLFQFNKRKK